MPHVVQRFRRTKMKRNSSCGFQIVLHLDMNCGFYCHGWEHWTKHCPLKQGSDCSIKWQPIPANGLQQISFYFLSRIYWLKNVDFQKKWVFFLRGRKLEDCQRQMELLKGLTEYNQVACSNICKNPVWRLHNCTLVLINAPIPDLLQSRKQRVVLAGKTRQRKLLCVWNSWNAACSAAFQSNQYEAQQFLRFSNSFAPGDELWFLLPTPDGNIGQNILL